METHSMDLRERVAAACDRGERHPGPSCRPVRRQRPLGRRPAAAATRDRLGRPQAARLRAAVRADADATLEELAAAAGVACSAPAVYRALRRLGITREKSRGGPPSRTGRR